MKKLFLPLLLLIGCDQATEFNNEYVTFGHFYGFCMGEGCIEIYRLTHESVSEDTNDTYPRSDAPYEGNFQKLNDALFEAVHQNLVEIPSELLSTPSGVIGIPDAADGGGIYFEVIVKGERKFWLLDKNRQYLPEYLHPFVDRVEAAIEVLR